MSRRFQTLGIVRRKALRHTRQGILLLTLLAGILDAAGCGTDSGQRIPESPADTPAAQPETPTSTGGGAAAAVKQSKVVLPTGETTTVKEGFGLVNLKLSATPPSPAPGAPPRTPRRAPSYQSGLVEVDEARIILLKFELESDNPCLLPQGETDDIDFQGPFVISLVESGRIPSPAISRPDLGLGQIPACRYDEIESQFEAPDEGQALPAGIEADPLLPLLSNRDARLNPGDRKTDWNSILVTGRFKEAMNDVNADGQIAWVPFILATDVEAEQKFRSSAGLLIDPARLNHVGISVDLDSWFTGVLPLLQSLSTGFVEAPAELILSKKAVRETPDQFERDRDILDRIFDTIEESIERSFEPEDEGDERLEPLESEDQPEATEED